MREIAPGEVFAYQTRPQDKGSTLKILLIEGNIVHVELRDLDLKGPGGATGSGILHFPVHREHLESSLVGEPIVREEVGEEWREGYDHFMAHSGIPFMVSVAEGIEGLEQALVHGKAVVQGDPPANMESYEGVQHALRGQPISRKMRVFLACNLPPDDPSVHTLEQMDCWTGLEGVFYYANVPADWGYQQIVFYTLAEKQEIDHAIASVIREAARDTEEIADDFFEERPRKSVPTLGGQMADFCSPDTNDKFNRILDSLQALESMQSQEQLEHPSDHPIHFARKVLRECGRLPNPQRIP